MRHDMIRPPIDREVARIAAVIFDTESLILCLFVEPGMNRNLNRSGFVGV